MVSVSPSLSISLALATVLLSIIGGAAAGDRSQTIPVLRIVSNCKHTNSPSLCVSSTKHYKNALSAAAATDPSSIPKLSIKSTVDKTMEAKELLASLMASNEQVNLPRESLQACQQLYEDAITNLNTSIKNIDAKAYADLKINLAAALSDYITCSREFNSAEPDSSVVVMNASLMELAKNNLALASILKHW